MVMAGLPFFRHHSSECFFRLVTQKHSDEWCLKNGKPAITIQEFPTAPEASQALLSNLHAAQLIFGFRLHRAALQGDDRRAGEGVRDGVGPAGRHHLGDQPEKTLR
jgi:hypothetical protein